jgi:hypothetical protein
MRRLLPLLLLTACAAPVDRPDALVADDRSGHWLDRPWPSDEVLVDGYVDWSMLPEANTPLGTTLTSGWAAQAAATVDGFGHHSSAYFRFAEVFDVQAGDVGITGPGGDVPVEWRWVEDPMGDPFLTTNLLIVTPLPTAPLASGTTYVAWVSTEVADPAEGWERPDWAPEDAAVATQFTVADSLGQLRSLRAAVDAALDANPEWLQPLVWEPVDTFRYAQGQTPGGRDATVATATYGDGTESVAYLSPRGASPTRSWDLAGDWPHEVYEARIRVPVFQDYDGAPWASPGLGLVGDFSRIDEGWLHFDGTELLDEPDVQELRLVVQVPRGEGAAPVMTWDHGTGGHAYNAVARANVGDRPSEVNEALADVVIVSRDQPLYGQRFPLIEEGFTTSIGFYNIGNLPAFRDNQRQSAAEHRAVVRFVQDVLPTLIDVDTSRFGSFGHSLGSVTNNGGLAAAAGDGPTETFLSGAGGYLAFYVLESGLLGTGNDVVGTIAPLLGLTAEELAEASPSELVGALIGLEEPAWPNVQRDHPVLQLFSAIMDPSDPIAVAPEQTVAPTILLGVGDLQVPNKTTEWLGEVTPGATTVRCEPTANYDGHWCLFREDVGIDALAEWAEGL